MKCNKCLKSFDDYLFRYTGQLTCPYCGEEIDVTAIELDINKENDEIFCLSEASFCKGLIDNNLPQVESGIKLCLEAMKMGHPKAYLRMGYYIEKNFMNNGKGELNKALNAFEHYSVVLFNQMGISGEFMKRYPVQTLKQNAAQSMIGIVLDNPELAIINKKYSPQFVLERIRSVIPTFVPPKGGSSRPLMIFDRIYDTLNAIDSNLDNALLGAYTLRSGQFKQLLNKGSLDDPLFKKLLSTKGLNMKYKLTDASDYSRLSSLDDFDDANSACDNNLQGTFNFAFFNANPKVSYIKSSQVLDVKKKLFDNESNLDSFFVKPRENGIVIYEDDIKFYSGKSVNIDKATRELLEEIE